MSTRFAASSSTCCFATDDGAWGASSGSVQGNGAMPADFSGLAAMPTDFSGLANFDSVDSICENVYLYGASVGTGMSFMYVVSSASSSVSQCSAYNASNTNYGQQNYEVCNIYACPGDTLRMSMCSADGGSCSGDTYLRLVSPTGQELAGNDDTCGVCASVEYTFSAGNTGHSFCTNYELRQGCFSSGNCSGYTQVSLSSGSSSSSSSESSLSAGAIVGIVFGSLFGVGLCICLCVAACCMQHNKRAGMVVPTTTAPSYGGAHRHCTLVCILRPLRSSGSWRRGTWA